jgi:hypothetical protein
MSTGDPAVVVMAAGGGTEPVAGLTAALASEAERWAVAVAPGRVHHVDGPLAGATARVLASRQGPLLVVWPVLARLRPDHATAALGDLRDGAELVVGPVIDGGVYLLGLSRPLGELVDMPDDGWSKTDAISTVLAAAARGGFEVGILRAERALRQPSDVRAALADPITPAGIREILRAG